MKIKNLYIGDVRMIVDVKYVPSKSLLPDIVYTTRYERISIFEKKGDRVKDIIYGGNYKIGNMHISGVAGDEYVYNLKQKDLIKMIKNNSDNKRISKRKLLKLVKANRERQGKYES